MMRERKHPNIRIIYSEKYPLFRYEKVSQRVLVLKSAEGFKTADSFLGWK